MALVGMLFVSCDVQRGDVAMLGMGWNVLEGGIWIYIIMVGISYSPGFDSRHYQIFCQKKKGKQVVGLERGSLSLVSTTEELLDRKVAAPV
jgi:hypothetical protein